MIKKFIALSVTFLIFTVVPSKSQQIGEGLVVSSCGTPGRTLTAGQNGPVTMDTTGVLCSGNNGGGGSSNVNIVEWDSVALGAPSLYGTSPGAVTVPGVNAFVTNELPQAVTTSPTAFAPTAGAFSSAIAASATRKGCLIQNVGTTLGYVYFGANGSATTSNTFQVAAGGGTINCSDAATIEQSNVSATCASGTCAFIVKSE